MNPPYSRKAIKCAVPQDGCNCHHSHHDQVILIIKNNSAFKTHQFSCFYTIHPKLKTRNRHVSLSYFGHPQTNAWEVSITCELLRWHILSSPPSRPASVRQSSTQRRRTQTRRGARRRCTWRGRSSPRWGGGGSGGETRSPGNSHWQASLMEGRGIRSPVRFVVLSLSCIQVKRFWVAQVTWINI